MISQARNWSENPSAPNEAVNAPDSKDKGTDEQQ